MDEEKGVQQEPAANTPQASQVVKPNGLALVSVPGICHSLFGQRHYSRYERYGNGLLSVPGSFGGSHRRHSGLYPHPGIL